MTAAQFAIRALAAIGLIATLTAIGVVSAIVYERARETWSIRKYQDEQKQARLKEAQS